MTYAESMVAKEKAQVQENIEICETIAEMAHDVFCKCGAPDDYCVQHIGTTSIIFGGWNRVHLTERGWSVSRSHCTSEFLAAWDKHYASK